ncbi:right-handed parallel beta-helix repeat-containing protein [Haliangium ochraceum]|nr:right-handed parallel beta-helix repeat-containing protein [Haliangium ochraceum]
MPELLGPENRLMHRLPSLSLAFVLLALLTLPGCPTKPNPIYCDGNVGCPDGNQVCNLDSNTCQDPPELCEEDNECDGQTPICGDDGVCRGCNEGECPSGLTCDTMRGDCFAEACEGNGDCPGGTPFCNPANDTCATCAEFPEGERDAKCGELDASTPYCSELGTCEACVQDEQCTDASAPVCDPESFACTGCKEHVDCQREGFSGVCDRDSGACFEASAILYVKQDVAESGAECTESEPCQTIAEALALLEADNENKKVITFLDDGPTTYVERIAPSASPLSLTILGRGQNETTIQGPNGSGSNPVVAIGADTQTSLEMLSIAGPADGSGQHGIRCIGLGSSSVHLDRVSVTNNPQQGLEMFQCYAEVTRTNIASNKGGGITLTNSSFRITNSFIHANGDPGDSQVGGVLVANNASTQPPQIFSFNTVYGNRISNADVAVGVECSASGMKTFSSNIVEKGNFTSGAVGGNCAWQYSAIQGLDDIDETFAPRDTNVNSTCGISVSTGALPRISAGSACTGLAEPDTGVLVDYDGDSRSTDTPDMGADEVTE